MMTFTNKLAVVAFTLATSTAAAGALACQTGGCTPTTPTGANTNTNNTNVGVNATGGTGGHASNTTNVVANPIATANVVANPTATATATQTLNNSVNTAGTVGAVTATGGSVAAGALTGTNTSTNVNSYSTTYKAAVSSAYGVTGSPVITSGCMASTPGFGVGLQLLGGGVSLGMSGKSEWSDASIACDKAQAENEIIREGGVPALLVAAEKSPKVVGKALDQLTDLTNPRVIALKALFNTVQAVPSGPASYAAPAPVSYTTNNYHITQQATKLCADKKPPTLNAKTGVFSCNM